MEFGAREILIVLGILVLVAIILDVIKRVRSSRYENIRMPRKRKQPVFNGDDQDVYGSELPNGGARVVGYREAEEAERIKAEVHKSSKADRVALKSFQAKPPEPGDSPAPDENSGQETGSEQTPGEENTCQQQRRPRQVKQKPMSARPASPQGSLPLGDDSGEEQASLVIAMHVMAEQGEQFKGEELKAALLEKDLRYGAMKIFHKHTEESGAGPVMFSVANLVKPGTFDLNTMEQFTTPGVTLFFDAAEVEQPAACFDQMLATAKYLSASLKGDIKDETRSDLTRQTIEHYRERIADLTRARRLGVK